MIEYAHSQRGVSKVLMNLLPGLRKLRAPLASGYLWLVALWLGLSRAGWLPSKRPPGNGEVARLWDLGGALGKTVLLAAITFIAYLIGSFLEIDPSGPMVLSSRLGFLSKTKGYFVPSSGFSLVSRHPRAISISPQAIEDLFALLQERGEFEQWTKVAGKEEIAFLSREQRSSRNAHFRDLLPKIIEEMPQLASRLLVKNKDLYGKYDNLMAEATLRINVSIPLTVVLTFATWLSALPIWLRITLTVIIAAFGFLLLRQGTLRAASARDVIVQALTIDEVQSRHIPPTNS